MGRDGTARGTAAGTLKRWRQPVQFPRNLRRLVSRRAVGGDSRPTGALLLLLWLTVAFAALPTAVAGQPATCGGDSRRPLVYTGDRDFPPYEYLDERDTPAGFNIQVIHALARELQVPIEIRLLSPAQAREARERGICDL